MIEQAEGLRFHPGLMLIDDADKPAKWYFALKQARLKGTGEHPMSGPVTLQLAKLKYLCVLLEWGQYRSRPSQRARLPTEDVKQIPPLRCGMTTNFAVKRQ